ncbi:MAG: sensor histidine kinase [Candidatus Dadabacteria bacterium]|nr:MAG: sensor histidine kinase [Candidatus Dadabacteria bacterium]
MTSSGTNIAQALATRDGDLWVQCFDRLGLAAVLIDDSADVIQASQQFRRQFSRAESLLDPFASESRGDLVAVLCRVFASQLPARVELDRRVSLAGVESATIPVWLFPVRTGGHAAILAVFEQRSDNDLEAARNDVLHELRGTVHDVNNLLTAAIGCAELLACHEYYDEALERDAEELREVLGRAGALMRQLLSELRGERARAYHLLDPARWLADREGLFRGICGNDITVSLRVAPDCWPVAIDPDRFEQVMINLVANARDACAPGGHVTISADNLLLCNNQGPEMMTERFLALIVEDTGCGFALDDAGKLFQPGYTSKPDGHGIGLAHSLSYLQEIGASVEIQSRPGGGSRFKIQIPAARHEPDVDNVLPLQTPNPRVSDDS